jgi:Helix-turn-helix domain
MILLVIADHASDDGTEAWPSQATIATKASVSIRTVQRCVNSLVRLGYVRMEKHAGGSATCREDRRPHRYTINLYKLRGDTMTGRQGETDGATSTPVTGRQQRPKNHPVEPPITTQSFDVFWKIYPRKVGKIAAKSAFEKALRVGTLEDILKGAERFASDPNRQEQFTPHPATWLNQGRWGDEPLPQRTLTPEERAAKAKAEAEERNKRERERQAELDRIDAEARKKAVPMPESVKALLRGINHS